MMLDTPTKSTKPFAWSYTMLRDYEACPRRMYHVRIAKDVTENITPDLERGNQLHTAMKARVMNNTPLPGHFSYLEGWAEKLTKILHPEQVITCETKLAIDRNYRPCGYFEKRTWVRVIADYLRVQPYNCNFNIAHIVDYKTGKPKEDDTQLILNALLVFGCYPDVIGVRTDFLWTEFQDTTTAHYVREDVPHLWAELNLRVIKLEDAYRNGEFPAKKCGLCRDYCPVFSCEYNGKRI